jgi:CobQ-like glutamine amidotransferase family enzyme
VHPGDPFPERADVVVGGGGQDSGQSKVTDDLGRHAERFRESVEDGTPMLLVCGMYQLFGRAFVTSEGERLPGIGVLDLETTGSSKRIIGNVAVESDEFGTVIGFENHSGRTLLGSGGRPLGHVAKGRGNNGTDGRANSGSDGRGNNGNDGRGNNGNDGRGNNGNDGRGNGDGHGRRR